MTCWVEKQTLTLLTGVTRGGVTCWVENQRVGATPWAGCGPGSTLPESKPLPLLVLKCGCVKGAGGVGRSISTELGGNLSPRGLLLGLAGTGGVLPLRGGLTITDGPLDPFFCDDLAVAVNLWVAPQPTDGCEAVGAYTCRSASWVAYIGAT